MAHSATLSRSQSDETRLSPAQRVTQQISALLERGVRPWVKPWRVDAPEALELPLRSCGQAYRGMNVVALWAAALERGYRARHWFTFKQALAPAALCAAIKSGCATCAKGANAQRCPPPSAMAAIAHFMPPART